MKKIAIVSFFFFFYVRSCCQGLKHVRAKKDGCRCLCAEKWGTFGMWEREALGENRYMGHWTVNRNYRVNNS